MKRKLLTTLIAFGLGVSAHAQIPTEMTSRFQTVMDSLVNDFESQNNELGLSMAVSIPGYGTWSGTSGHAEPGVAMTTDMTAGIASNSKLITAVILLKLQENGILSLDDQVSEWIPDELHDIDKTATIRQLLQHETGFFDYSNDRNEEYWADVFDNIDHFWTYEEQVDQIGAPHFEVGTAYRYSNTNYLLAGWIIENATGNSYAHNLHQYITTPLGMTRTFDAATDTEALDAGPESLGYVAAQWWPRLGSVAVASMFVGAGSIVATPGDMAVFHQALFNGDFLTADSKEQLKDFDPASEYGLAIWNSFTHTLSDGVYEHTGDLVGFHSQAIYDPKTGASVFYVINNDNAYQSGAFYGYSPVMQTVLRDYFPKQENDAGISRIISPVSSLCESPVAPEVVVKNYGSSTLATVTVNYRIDNNTPSTYMWNGSVASGETIEITLPVIAAAEGGHTLTAWTTNPNGSVEGNTYNDSSNAGFTVNPEIVTQTTFSEDFEGETSSVGLWNPNQFAVGQWGVTKLTGSSGNHSLARDGFGFGLMGDESYADLPMLHVGEGAQELRFTYAHSYWPGYEDTLEVLVSDDCGDTWESLFNKSGEELSYGLISDTEDGWPYFPHSDDEWHAEAIALDAYADSDVLIRFRHINGNSDNIYLDDISVGARLATAQFDQSKVLAYPNPASDKVTISGLPDDTLIKLYNISGQKLQETVTKGDTTLNLNGVAPGMYFVSTSYGSVKIIKN